MMHSQYIWVAEYMGCVTYDAYTPSTLTNEAFVYFVYPTEIPEPPLAWKYYLCVSI